MKPFRYVKRLGFTSKQIKLDPFYQFYVIFPNSDLQRIDYISSTNNIQNNGNGSIESEIPFLKDLKLLM